METTTTATTTNLFMPIHSISNSNSNRKPAAALQIRTFLPSFNIYKHKHSLHQSIRQPMSPSDNPPTRSFSRHSTLLNMRTDTDSKPMQQASQRRPKPLQPHGIKTAISNMLQLTRSPSSRKEKGKINYKLKQSPPDFEVLAAKVVKATNPLPRTPVVPLPPTPTIASPTSAKSFVAPAADAPVGNFYVASEEVPDTSEELTPVVTVDMTLSRKYKKLLSRKYSYSSIYSKSGTLNKNVYTKPDLSSFYSQQSDVDETDEESTSEVSDDGAVDQTNASQDTTIKDDDFVYPPYNPHEFDDDSASQAESSHTIHNLSFLPIISPHPETLPTPTSNQIKLSTGHLQLLETYSDIIGEISELVPHAPKELLNRRKLSACAVHLEELLLMQPPVSPRTSMSQEGQDAAGSDTDDDGQAITPTGKSSVEDDVPSLKAEVVSNEDDVGNNSGVEFVIEEYYVKHWAPTVLDGIVSSDTDSEDDDPPAPIKSDIVLRGRLESDQSAFSVSAYEGDIGEGNAEVRQEIASREPESLFVQEDTVDDAHLIVSKVTRVVTLSRNQVVQNVDVKVEPIGKVADKRDIRTADQLKAFLVEKRSGMPMLVEKLKGDDDEAAKGKVITKRRSGLSSFLQFLASPQ